MNGHNQTNEASVGSGPWCEGHILVVHKEGQLPECCIKCGGPPAKHLRMLLTWHHPALSILVAVSIFIYYLVDVLVRNKAHLIIPVCGSCNSRRVRNLVIGFLSFFLGIGLIVAAFALVDSHAELTSGLCLVGIAFFLFSLFWAIWVEFLIVKKMTDRFVWIGKVSKDMLATLPRWPGE